ncbi:cytochrome P450 [Nesidiocoris tenuis]|uniref:Cytochrome P450 n=1 Tax=Nesidiocoris tenuis TaxID=355587 RepID=A0ABN7A8Y7_9HEMI|nr:cytochrome P450 [Nesidiocoris tenuis]
MATTGQLVIGSLVAALVIYVIHRLRKLANFFSDRNIPYIPNVWPFGSAPKIGLLRENPFTGWNKLYSQLAPHKVGGVYSYINPIVMVRDPELVHRVYTTDFSSFVDRGFTVDEAKDPLDGHLFFLSGEKWRYLRAKLSPIFTSGKLKWMFDQMKSCSDKFVDTFEEGLDFSKDIDLRETFARFTTDVITSCAFGIENNAIDDPNNEFRKIGKQFFKPARTNSLFLVARMSMPKLLAWLKIKTIDQNITDFFIDVVKQTFHHRLSTNYVRKDFVQLLLELREKGEVKTEEFFGDKVKQTNGQEADEVPKNKVLDLNDALLTAQLFVFFVAGFETTSSTMLATFYFLARNPECQQKAREEAKRVLEKNGGFTYESLKDLSYLQHCIDETLRMLPPVSMNFRVAANDYQFSNGIRIEKGTHVLLPTISLHYDPEYFPEPHKFKPERFEGQGPIKGTYAPFGDGPRICIGKRFAEVEMKLTIAKLLLIYNFLPGKEDCDVHDYIPGALTAVPRKPLYVRLQKL